MLVCRHEGQLLLYLFMPSSALPHVELFYLPSYVSRLQYMHVSGFTITAYNRLPRRPPGIVEAALVPNQSGRDVSDSMRDECQALCCRGITQPSEFRSTGSGEPLGNVRCAYGSPEELSDARDQRHFDGAVSRRSLGRGALVPPPGVAQAGVGFSKGLLSCQVCGFHQG